MAVAGLSNGVKITVDTSDIDVKFTRSIEQLNAGLTKTQRSLKLTYNSNGELTDSLERCVEGLTTAQIKLGMWVDENARARTFNGGFADGLSRTELELGAYADALGNVHKKTGEILRAAKENANVQDQTAHIFGTMREAASDLRTGWKTRGGPSKILQTT